MNNELTQALSEFHKSGTKDDHIYGKQIAQALLGGAAIGGGASSQWYIIRNRQIEESMKFVKGQQDMAQFLSYLGIDAKKAYVNLDLKSLAIAPKYVRRLTQRFLETTEKPDVKAVDEGSHKEKVRRKDEAEFRMRMGGDISELSSEGGVPLEDPEAFVPDDYEDLQLWDEMENLLDEEIEFENGILNVLNDNDIKEIKKRAIRSLITAGYCQAIPYWDANKRIKIRFVDPRQAIYGAFTYDDARDCVMAGELKRMKISEFRSTYPKISEKKLFEYAEKSSQVQSAKIAWKEEYNTWSNRPYDDVLIEVLIFRLKTIGVDNTVVKTTRNNRVVAKTETGVPEPAPNKSVISKQHEVIYKGTYVVGAMEMAEWELASNMIKPHHALHEVFLDYVISMPEVEDNTSTSLVEIMIPSIRKMCVIDLKIQQLIVKMKADGIEIDPTRLTGVDLGDGNTYTPQQIVEIWEQSGVLFNKSFEDDGETRKDSPIKPLEFLGSVNKLAALSQEYQRYETILMSDIGSNESVDGVGVSDRKGLGVMQNQINTSNRATEYIYEGWKSLLKGLAKRIAVMLWQDIVYGNNKHKTNLTKEQVESRTFDLEIEMLPNDGEVSEFVQIAQTALSAGTITFEEVVKLKRVAKRNIKLAEIMLAKYEKKRKLQAQQDAQMNSQITAQAQMQSNQQTHDNQLQMEQLKGQMKIEVQKLMNEGDNNKALGGFLMEMMKAKIVEGKQLPPEIEQLSSVWFQNLLGQQGKQITDTQTDMQQQEVQMQQQQQEGVA